MSLSDAASREALLVSYLSTLIGFNSVSDRSNLEIAAWLRSVVEPLGFRIIEQHHTNEAGVRKVNLLCAIGPQTGEALIFAGHTDTVPPGDLTRWTATAGEPWQATLHEGKLYGLGASDLKGGIACTLALAHLLPKLTLRKEVILLYTFDEEVGLLGVRELLAGRVLDPQGKLVVLVEPTYNLVVLSEKGYLALDVDLPKREAAPVQGRLMRLTTLGKEAHSGRPHQGDNAIRRMGAVLEEVFLAAPSAKLVDIGGGVARNSVAGGCWALLDLAEQDLPTLREWTVAYAPHLQLTEEPAREGLHSSRRALDEIAQLIPHFTKFEARLCRAEQDERFDPPYAAFNIGRVYSQEQGWRFEIDARPIPCQSTRETGAQLLDHLRALGIEVRTTVIFDDIEPFATPESSPFRQRFNDLHDPLGKAAYTEAGAFAPAGFDCVIIGPGNTLVHRPNEMIEVSALLRGLEVYERVVREICVE